MDQRDDTDTLSADVTMTFTWREWSLLASAVIIAEGNRKLTRDEQRQLRDLAGRIDHEMSESDAFTVWQAEQWTKAPTPGPSGGSGEEG